MSVLRGFGLDFKKKGLSTGGGGAGQFAYTPNTELRVATRTAMYGPNDGQFRIGFRLKYHRKQKTMQQWCASRGATRRGHNDYLVSIKRQEDERQVHCFSHC